MHLILLLTPSKKLLNSITLRPQPTFQPIVITVLKFEIKITEKLFLPFVPDSQAVDVDAHLAFLSLFSHISDCDKCKTEHEDGFGHYTVFLFKITLFNIFVMTFPRRLFPLSRLIFSSLTSAERFRLQIRQR